MRASYLSSLILTAFLLSAVFGLCAMVMDSTENHSHSQAPCGQNTGIAICEGNQVRRTLFEGFLIAGLIVAIFVSQVVGIPKVQSDAFYFLWRARQWRERVFSPVLLQAFSRGILQRKVFA